MKLDASLRPLLLGVASLLLLGAPPRAPDRDGVAKRPALPASLSRPPMRFEADGAGRFVGHARGAAIALETTGARLAVRGKDESTTLLSMRVANGRAVAPVASDLLPTKVNRLIGDDKTKWKQNVSTYGKVTYPSVLDGVDLVFHGEDGQLEYDFVVAPGKDPSEVAMDIEGGDALSLTEGGDLSISTGQGVLLQKRPRVFQRDAAGRETEVEAAYRITGDRRVAFHVADYDRTQPLVIDPVLGYATFLGGENADVATGLVTFGSDTFVVGHTLAFSTFDSGQFVNAGGAAAVLHEIRGVGSPPTVVTDGQDAWVAKLDDAGRVVYLTFFGGTRNDSGSAIAVDETGRIYVTGQTASFDLKTTENAYQPDLHFSPDAPLNRDAYLMTLNGDGSDVTYSTYLDVGSSEVMDAVCPTGGLGPTCEIHYSDDATSIAVSGGQVYIAGITERGAFHTVLPAAWPTAEDPAARGVYVTSLTAPTNPLVQGERTARHLFGGGGLQAATGLTVTGGLVYVGGQICNAATMRDAPSGFQPNLHGGCDGFVAALPPSLAGVTWLSLLGGTGTDRVTGLASLPNGHVWVSGTIGAPDPFATCPADCVQPPSVNASLGGSDGFVAHLDASRALVWLRLLGGALDDDARALAVDPLGHTYVTGYTRSTDFPTTVPMALSDAEGDAFVSEVAADGGSLLVSAYFGSSESADFGQGIALSSAGVHLCGSTVLLPAPAAGAPAPSPLFPPLNATQPARAGGAFDYDAFIAKIASSPLVLTPATSTVVPGTEIGFVATGGVGFGYRFEVVTSGSGAPTIDPGTGHYTAGVDLGDDLVRVTDPFGNVASATVAVVSAQAAELLLSPTVTSTPPRGAIAFRASGGTLPYAFELISNASNGTISGTGQYHAGSRGDVTDRVRVTDGAGHSKTATITVTSPITVTPGAATLAQGAKLRLSAAGGKGGPYTWTADNGGSISTDGELTGPAANVVVKVTATDALGNTGTATVAIGTAIAITPIDPETFPRGSVQFSAVGGSGGYQFAVVTAPPAGASIDPANGLFSAGPSGGVTETVDVKDSANRHATTTVRVGPSLTLAPEAATLAGNSQLQLRAAGGSGVGYGFFIESSQSGASIDNATGLFTAGPNAGEDVVRLADSAGNEARARLTVTAAPSEGGGGGKGDGGGTGGGGQGSGTNTVSVGSGSGSDDGCSTVTVGNAPPSSSALAGLGLGLLLATRRRRRRRAGQVGARS